MMSIEMETINGEPAPNKHKRNEHHFNEKFLLRAALYLLFPATVPDVDKRVDKLLLLPRQNNSRLKNDIEEILNLNAGDRKRHKMIVECIMEILQKGVQDKSIKQILETAVVYDNLNVIEMLLKPMLKPNELSTEDANKYLPKLLQKCCDRGLDKILEFLWSIIPQTESDCINNRPLLCCVLKEMNPRDSENTGFQRCLDLLLNDDRVMFDLPEGQNSRRTPLYFAARQRNDSAQMQLLAKGAFLGALDMRQRMPVDYIDPILLENHLNTCVKDSDTHLLDDRYELTLDFKNFIPKQGATNTNNTTPPCNTNPTDSKDIEANLRTNETPSSSSHQTTLSKVPHAEDSSSLIASEKENQKKQKVKETTRPEINQQLPESELSIILALAQESANHGVLQHPVISCILAIKRADLYWFRWIYCLYYLIHYVILMSVWTWCNYAADNCIAITFFIYFLMFYMSLRWLVCMGMDLFAWKLKLLPKVRNLVWRLLWRLVQLVPIALLIEIVFKKGYPWISATSMIVLAVESTLVLLKIQWCSISTILIMFMRVLYTFCKSLIPFSTILVGCLFSFHILFKDTSQSDSASLNQNVTQGAQNVCEEINTSNEFQTFEDTSRKVFIMMAGELNTEKIDLQTAPRALMFFTFVLVIVIVWNNFMNSLAVDDTVGMRAKSQFLAIKQDVIFMQRLETILKIMKKWCGWPQLKSLPSHISIKPNKDHPAPGVQIDNEIINICKTIIQQNDQNSLC